MTVNTHQSTVSQKSGWTRFLAPYYLLNILALLIYIPVRFYSPNGHVMEEIAGLVGVRREFEISLLVLVSLGLKYRQTATWDQYFALALLYCKTAVWASFYYIDIRICGWYMIYCLIIYITIPYPKYAGPTAITILTPTLFERMVLNCGDKIKKPKDYWFIYCHANSSEFSRQHDPMIAQISLEFSSTALHFGSIDLSLYSHIAKTLEISMESTAYQLPTLLLYHKGKIICRRPQLKKDGTDGAYKTLLTKKGIIAVFRLEELKNGNQDTFSTSKNHNS